MTVRVPQGSRSSRGGVEGVARVVIEHPHAMQQTMQSRLRAGRAAARERAQEPERAVGVVSDATELDEAGVEPAAPATCLDPGDIGVVHGVGLEQRPCQ